MLPGFYAAGTSSTARAENAIPTRLIVSVLTLCITQDLIVADEGAGIHRSIAERRSARFEEGEASVNRSMPLLQAADSNAVATATATDRLARIL